MRWFLVVALALVPIGAAAAETEAAPVQAEDAAANAEAEAEETVIREDDKLVFEKETRVNFNDGQVDGDLLRPDGEVVRTGPKAKFESMIRQRRDFNEELLESIDE